MSSDVILLAHSCSFIQSRANGGFNTGLEGSKFLHLSLPGNMFRGWKSGLLKIRSNSIQEFFVMVGNAASLTCDKQQSA